MFNRFKGRALYRLFRQYSNNFVTSFFFPNMSTLISLPHTFRHFLLLRPFFPFPGGLSRPFELLSPSFSSNAFRHFSPFSPSHGAHLSPPKMPHSPPKMALFEG